ncbi:HNH endonuclease [Solibacillus sp. FSL H8-0538]|uniref:HNH endonuclease n=1 Tax=Solibacillus sp. FSL H8-0538 TaxID=2921400 RepID=UPI0030FC2F2E
MEKQTLESKKVCRHCHIEKPLSQFEAQKRNKDGHTNRCKSCRCKHRYESGAYQRERERKHSYRSNRPTYYTDEIVQRMMSATHCVYCGEEGNRINGDANELVMDHVYHVGGNAGHNIDDNIVACHRGCNTSKGRLHVYDFYQSSERFTDDLWHEFVKQFASRLLNREPTPSEIEAWKQGFADEAFELTTEVK